MEDLLVSSVRRSTNASIFCSRAQVFDMVENNVCRLAVVSRILSTPQRSNVARDPCVEDDVFFSGVVIYGHSTDHLEPVAQMDLLGDAT